MKITLLQITEEQFYRLTMPVLFNDIKTSRSFSTITNGVRYFKFAWQSDLITPVITEIDTAIYSIGIDQSFVVIDFNKNSVPLNLNLPYIL